MVWCLGSKEGEEERFMDYLNNVNNQPERSKREDPTNFYPEIMDNIKNQQDKMIDDMLGCGALNSMET